MKRNYQSGAQKRQAKRRKIVEAASNPQEQKQDGKIFSFQPPCKQFVDKSKNYPQIAVAAYKIAYEILDTP